MDFEKILTGELSDRETIDTLLRAINDLSNEITTLKLRLMLAERTGKSDRLLREIKDSEPHVWYSKESGKWYAYMTGDYTRDFTGATPAVALEQLAEYVREAV